MIHSGKFTTEEINLYIQTKEIVKQGIKDIKRQEANKQMNHFFDSNCQRG